MAIEGHQRRAHDHGEPCPRRRPAARAAEHPAIGARDRHQHGAPDERGNGERPERRTDGAADQHAGQRHEYAAGERQHAHDEAAPKVEPLDERTNGRDLHPEGADEWVDGHRHAERQAAERGARAAATPPEEKRQADRDQRKRERGATDVGAAAPEEGLQQEEARHAAAEPEVDVATEQIEREEIERRHRDDQRRDRDSGGRVGDERQQGQDPVAARDLPRRRPQSRGVVGERIVVLEGDDLLGRRDVRQDVHERRYRRAELHDQQRTGGEREGAEGHPWPPATRPAPGRRRHSSAGPDGERNRQRQQRLQHERPVEAKGTEQEQRHVGAGPQEHAGRRHRFPRRERTGTPRPTGDRPDGDREDEPRQGGRPAGGRDHGRDALQGRLEIEGVAVAPQPVEGELADHGRRQDHETGAEETLQARGGRTLDAGWCGCGDHHSFWMLKMFSTQTDQALMKMLRAMIVTCHHRNGRSRESMPRIVSRMSSG